MRKKAVWVLLEHLPVALIFGLVSAVLTGKPEHVWVALTFGWLVDADHLVDYFYFICVKRKKPSIKEFFSAKYFEQSGKVFVPFHSFELCGLLFLGAYFEVLGLTSYFLTGAISLCAHLLHDQLTNTSNRFGYFLIARCLKKFSIDWFCGKKTVFFKDYDACVKGRG